MVISEIVDRFIATDHNEAKLEYERLQDPNSWVAPRNAAIPCFLEVSRALVRFMARMRRSLTPPADGTVNADPIDSLFFLTDQNGKSSYLLFRSMVEQVEKDIYEYQYMDFRVCSQTLILPLTQQLRDVEAVADRIQTDKAIA